MACSYLATQDAKFHKYHVVTKLYFFHFQGVGFYQSATEADMRFVCFKQSVDEVNEVNSQNLGWVAGIWYFVSFNSL